MAAVAATDAPPTPANPTDVTVTVDDATADTVNASVAEFEAAAIDSNTPSKTAVTTVQVVADNSAAAETILEDYVDSGDVVDDDNNDYVNASTDDNNDDPLDGIEYKRRMREIVDTHEEQRREMCVAYKRQMWVNGAEHERRRQERCAARERQMRKRKDKHARQIRNIEIKFKRMRYNDDSVHDGTDSNDDTNSDDDDYVDNDDLVDDDDEDTVNNGDVASIAGDVNNHAGHQHPRVWDADDADNPVDSAYDVYNDTTVLFTILKFGAAIDDDTNAPAPAPAGNYITIELPVNPVPPNTTPHLVHRASFQRHGTPYTATVNHLLVATAIELPLNPVPPNTIPHLLHRVPSNYFKIHCLPLNTTINRLPVATAIGIAVNPVPPNTTPHLIHLAPSPPIRFAHLWISPFGGVESPIQSDYSSYEGGR